MLLKSFNQSKLLWLKLVSGSLILCSSSPESCWISSRTCSFQNNLYYLCKFQLQQVDWNVSEIITFGVKITKNHSAKFPKTCEMWTSKWNVIGNLIIVAYINKRVKYFCLFFNLICLLFLSLLQPFFSFFTSSQLFSFFLYLPHILSFLKKSFSLAVFSQVRIICFILFF